MRHRHHFHNSKSNSELLEAVSAARPPLMLRPGGRRGLSASHAICGDNDSADALNYMSYFRELPVEHADERSMSLSFIVSQISPLEVEKIDSHGKLPESDL